ncbi:MAG: cysteine synthase family protein [Candidatus Pacebacteria bacterium]|nr:cysteine synthase family protein [Candidatus Paceibacterota bacterium]
MKTFLELIGNTPILKIEEFPKIYAKLEGFNPGGSIKDRAALAMIESAEKQGILKKGDTLIEVTSGNTGIAMAMIAAAKGYNIKVITTSNTSKGKIKIIEKFGGEVIFDDRLRQDIIPEIKEKIKNGEKLVYLNQYENENNVIAHYEGTGKEIVEQMEKEESKIDFFVAGIGTGGTITGIAKKLKEKYPDIKIIGVIPQVGHEIIEGIKSIKEGFVPPVMDEKLIDEMYELTEEQSLIGRDYLASSKGILVGPSSGASMYAALEVGKKNPEKVIVTVFPDRGERYI